MPVASTWNERELPILEAVYEAEERGERPDDDTIGQRLGMERSMVKRTVHALVEARFLDGIDDSSHTERFAHISLRLREPGRRAIGQWPTNAAEALLARLDDVIAVENEEGRRAGLQRVRSAVADVLKQGAGGVLSQAIIAGAQAASIVM